MSANQKKDEDSLEITSLNALKKILTGSKSIQIEGADGKLVAYQVKSELLDKLFAEQIDSTEDQNAQDTEKTTQPPLPPFPVPSLEQTNPLGAGKPNPSNLLNFQEGFKSFDFQIPVLPIPNVPKPNKELPVIDFLTDEPDFPPNPADKDYFFEGQSDDMLGPSSNPFKKKKKSNSQQEEMKNPQSFQNPQSSKSELSEDFDARPKKTRLEQIEGIKPFSPRNDSLRKVQSLVQPNDLNPNFIKEPDIENFIDLIIKKYEFDDNLDGLQSDGVFIAKIKKLSQSQLVVVITTLFKCLKQKTQEYDKLFKCLLRKFSMSQDQDLHQLIDQVNDQINERTHIIFAFSMPLLCEVKDENGNIVKKELPRIQYQKEYQNIIKGISGVDQNLRIRMVCATSNSIKRILSENPIALHFAGHGAKNCPENFPNEVYPNLRNKGDFLILEQDEDGSPSYLCESDLREIFQQLKQQIQFVFVASCHSEMIGLIFRKAGAKHVICVRENEPIMDEAILYFSENFYKILFENNKTICAAYWEVKEMLAKKYPTEAWKMLIIRDVDEYNQASDQSQFYADQLKNNKICNCCQLGPFDKGQLTDLNKLEGKAFETQRINTSNKFLIGRSLEISDIIQKLNQLKMLTVIGPIGIGKTLIAQNVCHYLQERNKFKNGVIQISIKSYDFAGMVIPNLYKSIQMNIPDLLRKVKEDTLINKNALSKSLKNNQDDQHIDKIQDKLSLINRCLRDMDVLIWVDNMLDDIHNDTDLIQEILDEILENCPQVKILYTSRQPLTQNFQSNELDSIYRITKLSKSNAVELFLKKAQIKIEFEDDRQRIIEFLNHSLKIDTMKNLTQDQSLNGQVNLCKYLLQKLETHPLFDKLNGNPTVIILNASKTQQNYDLIRIDQLLRSETFETLQPLTASMETSYQWIKEHNLEQAQILCLVGLMPKGLQLEELKKIWPMDKAFDILNSLIDFSLIEHVTIKGNCPVYLYKVILPFMCNFIELKSQELFPENEMHNSIIAFFVKEMIEVYDKIDVEEYSHRQEEFKEWLSLHQQNIWAALLRIQAIQSEQNENSQKSKSESSNMSIGSVNRDSLNLETDSDERSPPLKDTKKRLLIRQRSSSVTPMSRPLIAKSDSVKEDKLKVVPVPVLDRLIQQPAAPTQAPPPTKISPVNKEGKDVCSIQNKQQYLQVNNKLKNIFNKAKKADDQSSNQSFSERLHNSSMNKSFTMKSTPLKRFGTIRSSRDHLKLMSKYEEEVSSTYNHVNASRIDQREVTSKLTISKQSSTSIKKVIPSYKLHSDISSNISKAQNKLTFGQKFQKRISKKNSEETKSSSNVKQNLVQEHFNQMAKRESLKTKLNLSCLPDDAQLLLYYTSCLIINKQNELAIQSLRLFEKIQIQCQSPELTTIVQLNVKKLLAIAQFNMNINLNEAEEYLNYSKNEFLRLRVVHGVAVCALAKAYFLFTKYELLVSENYDRSIELILADSHNECQIAYQNFATINSQQGMEFCLNLEDELKQKKETLEPSILKDSFNLVSSNPKMLENKQGSDQFRYRLRQQGKAISLMIEFSINQILEDEITNLEKYLSSIFNARDQGLSLNKNNSGNWISHQRQGEENVHYKAQEEESKDTEQVKKVPTSKFLYHVKAGQIQNESKQKKPQKSQSQIEGVSKEHFKKAFAKQHASTLLKNEYEIKKLSKQSVNSAPLTQAPAIQKQAPSRPLFYPREVNRCQQQFFVVSIILEAIEINLPKPENRNKNKQLSIVIKRGPQQRFESERIKYSPLNKSQVESNKKEYNSIARMFDSRSSDAVNHLGASVDGFSVGRAASHRILDLSKSLKERSLIRNCKFQYKTVRYNQTLDMRQKYKHKLCELKIEGYDTENASYRDSRQRKGYKKLNLADYIGQGRKTVTFKMNDEGSIYLTVQIYVQETQEYDKSNMVQQNVSYGQASKNADDASDDDSDEIEISGQIFRHTIRDRNSSPSQIISNSLTDAQASSVSNSTQEQKFAAISEKSMNKLNNSLVQKESFQNSDDLIDLFASKQEYAQQQKDLLDLAVEQEEYDLLEMNQQKLQEFEDIIEPRLQQLSMKDQNMNMGFSQEQSQLLEQAFPMQAMSQEDRFLEQNLDQMNPASQMLEERTSNYSKSSFTTLQSQQMPLLGNMTEEPKGLLKKLSMMTQSDTNKVKLQVTELDDDEVKEEYKFKRSNKKSYQLKKQSNWRDSQQESVKITDKKSMNKLKIGVNNKFKKKSQEYVEEAKQEPQKFIKITNLDDDDKKYVATYHLLPSVQFQQNLEDPIDEKSVESDESEIEDHPIDEFQNEMNKELEPVSNYKEIIEEKIGAKASQPNQEEVKTMKITCKKGHMLDYSESVPEFFMEQYKKDLINLIITCNNCKQEIPHNASRLQCRQCDLDYCEFCMYEDQNQTPNLKRKASFDQKEFKLDKSDLQNKSLNKSGGSRKSETKIESPSQQNFIQKIFNKVIPKKKETMKEPKPSNRESIYKERRVTKIRARAKSFSQDPTQKELDSPLIDDKPLIQDAYAEELFRQHPSYADVSVKDIDLINAMVVIIKKKVKIEICSDTDITKETTTCIVNSAGPHLAHYSGGLPGQIVRHGGHEIQSESQKWIKQYGTLKRGECAYTGAGALPSKYIIHAVGPDWWGDNQKQSIRELNRCVKNVLRLACSEEVGPDIESISIPPISTGYKNGPKELCTRQILETCIKYCSRKNTGKLQLIRLCCVDTESANHFQVALLNFFANANMKLKKQK